MALKELQDLIQSAIDRLNGARGDLEGFYGESAIVDQALEAIESAVGDLDDATNWIEYNDEGS